MKQLQIVQTSCRSLSMAFKISPSLVRFSWFQLSVMGIRWMLMNTRIIWMAHQQFKQTVLQLDRWWSSLGASLSCVVGGMLSERVRSMHTLCILYEKGFVWSSRWIKLTYVKHKDAWRHWQGSVSMKRFAGLSLVPASQLRGCLCFLLFHRRHSQSCNYTHCTVHIMSVGIAARQRGHVQHISIKWMGRTRPGGRSIDLDSSDVHRT